MIFIPDPDFSIPDPDPGVKKHQIPDTGSGSATMSVHPILRIGWFASIHPPASVTVADVGTQSYSIAIVRDSF
jgi:hypothetical protein